MSNNTKTILLVLAIILIVGAIIAFFMSEEITNLTAPKEQITNEQPELTSTVAQDLEKATSDAVIDDIESDLAELEGEYDFNSQFDVAEFDIPDLSKELNTEI